MSRRANAMKGGRCHHTQFLSSRIALVLLAVLEEKNVLEMHQCGLVLWKVGSRLQGLLLFCVFCPKPRDPVCRREHWLLSPSFKKRRLCLTWCLEDRKELWADDLILLLLLVLALKSVEHSVTGVTEAGAWKRLEPCRMEG